MRLAEVRPALGRASERLGHDHALVALIALLGAGLLVRIYFLTVWSPAITGYSDSGIYFQDAVQSVWTDPFRTVGYSMFLRVLHGISAHLIFVTIVQHLLGLATALLFYLAVRRCGGPRGLGLVPAAIIIFGGDQLFLEHSALSDSLLVFLLGAALYCTVRGSQGRAWWVALAGVMVGLGVWVRGEGVALVPVIALWLLFSSGRPTRRTAAVAALALVASLATVSVYVAWRSAETGLSGLTTNSNWYLYGRVAPWADCNKFTAPRGTAYLCEAIPPSRRQLKAGDDYIFATDSPAQQLIGPPFEVSRYPHAMDVLFRWSEAAVLGQPLDYLNAVWLDTIRLFDPNHRSYGSLSADEMMRFLIYGPDRHSGLNEFVTSWQTPLYPNDPPAHHGDIAPLKTWEKLTRVTGVWMAILLALNLAGPWLAVRGTRAGTTLFAATSLTLLFFPILVKGYDYRYVISAFAPLAAAGALAGYGLVARIRARWRPPSTHLAGPDGAAPAPTGTASASSGA
jgi:4-amino-4-deoxy-L-arabinose transferase-like glycosyltransferase